MLRFLFLFVFLQSTNVWGGAAVVTQQGFKSRGYTIENDDQALNLLKALRGMDKYDPSEYHFRSGMREFIVELKKYAIQKDARSGLEKLGTSEAELAKIQVDVLEKVACKNLENVKNFIQIKNRVSASIFLKFYDEKIQETQNFNEVAKGFDTKKQRYSHLSIACLLSNEKRDDLMKQILSIQDMQNPSTQTKSSTLIQKNIPDRKFENETNSLKNNASQGETVGK